MVLLLLGAGLSLLPSRAGATWTKIRKNVDHLRVELPTLRLMWDRTHPPRYTDATVLEGGVKLGRFWTYCKFRKRCAKPPYDRLLANPVLRADYRCPPSDTRGPVVLIEPRRMSTTYGPSCPL